jgi:hypothetical protein
MPSAASSVPAVRWNSGRRPTTGKSRKQATSVQIVKATTTSTQPMVLDGGVVVER